LKNKEAASSRHKSREDGRKERKMASMTIELSEYVIDAIADAVVKKMQNLDGKADVLGKIRAEIEDLNDADYDFEGYYKAVTDVLQIIDRHRTDRQ
jgi:hypothetical protein